MFARSYPGSIAVGATLIAASLFFMHCQQPDTGVEELALIDPSGSILYVDATDIDTDINPSCGIAAPDTGTEGEGEGGGETEEQDKYKIISSLTLTNFQRLDMRFVYDRNRTNYRLLPDSSTETTCNTSDLVVCDSAGTLSCPTSDGIRCGAANTVNWVDYVSGRSFFARTGNIDYSEGFTLNSAKDEVQFMELDITVANLSGVTLLARVLCITEN